MKEFVSILLIGISLSMDTFSLSLSLGSLSIKTKLLNFFPFLVAIFHFVLPLLGNIIGSSIIKYLNIAGNVLLGLVLIFLSINLAIQYFKKEEINIDLKPLSVFLLAFSVSIDAFTIGLGISDITNKYFLSSILFSTCSFSFTSIGLIIGKYASKYIGSYANILGLILLLVLGLYHLI